MAKILKNVTAFNISIADTGVTILASPGSYTIPQQDYLLWAASDNIITKIGSGDIVVNDGSFDLSISDGTDLIKGLFPAKVKIENVPNETILVQDNDSLTVLNSIAQSLGAATSGVYKFQTQAVTSRNETDLTSTIYTVPTGKKFSINNFTGSYNLQFSTIIRFKKQTGGSGSFNTLFEMNLEVGGQGQSTIPINFGNGVIVGQAGDVFKITYETTNARGNISAFFTGNEI